VAKVKVVNTNLDLNLNNTNFNNTASEIIFSFGSFAITSNFEGRKYIDYTNELSSFVRPITLETLGITQIQSEILYNYSVNAVLNLDKSNLNTFVRFGSAYEFLRIIIQNIILTYPGSIFVDSQTNRGGNTTYFDFNYNSITNISTFKVPTGYTVNTFGLIMNKGNLGYIDNELRNLNLSYNKYIIWSSVNPTGNSYSIIGFTGYSFGQKYLTIQTIGNPFPNITGTSGMIDFHIKPNNVVFEEFRVLLNDYEKYVVSERDDTNGFKFILKDPTLLDNGTIIYSNASMLWTTGDKYNIDINTPKYRSFLDAILTIGNKYDSIKTDLIARFLTPQSLKTYDLTEEGKMTKLLRLYGREFDQLKQFIDSLVDINHVTYDKINNIPDQLIKNLAKTFGWEYFSLVNENELVKSFLTIDDTEKNLNTDLLPAEIDVELWRRILLNTNYFWKSKGTRQAIKSMFLLIGIPEPFINITEYVYTVDGKINPNTVELSQSDFPTNSLPYNTEGYPVAPLETNDFYFQVSGNTDSGQAYMNVFRMAGFNLMQTVDNKKSWIQTGTTTRIHYTTPQYYQEDSRLVLNTKEIDVALDTARGIEYDVFDYIKYVDFPANSSGYTLPFSFVNISLNYTGAQNIFTLPTPYDKTEGDLEVRYNGILLNGAKVYSGGSNTYFESIGDPTNRIDYIVSGNSFTLLTESAITAGNRRDVVQATFVYSGGTHPVTGITVEYIVTRVKPSIIGTVIPLPSYPRGDIQVTMNGIALTKGTSQFTADYIVDPNNTTGSSQIIIQNPEVISYLAINPDVQVAYITVIGSNDIAARSEVLRVDSFNSSKIYFNHIANKYVYRLNYKVNNVSDLKVLINGIALEPIKDYNINIMNPFEIFLPNGIRYGTVISIYYLVGGNAYFMPIVSNLFGVGDISQLSFLEFIELIQRRLINVRNRKTITDFRGGWYPTLLRIYIEYLKRADGDTLISNGYTFENLYSFLSKYNTFFQRFVDQLLSATIILKKNGLLIRNSMFTKQKFTYKRGVNFNVDVNYLGDDGSVFLSKQEGTPPPPPPPILYVETLNGVLGSLITGGKNIIGFNILTEYGIKYRKWHDVYPYGDIPIGLENLLEGITEMDNIDGWGMWMKKSVTGSLNVDNFTMTLTDLENNTIYQYRAYVKSGIYEYTGNTLQITTLPAPIISSITTRTGTAGIYSIEDTGGIDITGYGDIDYYGMQYRVYGATTWKYSPAPPSSGHLHVNNFLRTITGLLPVTNYEYRAFMSINGIRYYGQIKQIATLPIPIYVPTILTGNAFDIGTTNFNISGNTITNNGNLPITEYGLFYTQNSTYGTSLTLKNQNYPTHVCKTSLTGSGGTTPFIYSGCTNHLGINTTTYFRAFAKNDKGFGYGNVKTQLTDGPVSVYLTNVEQLGTDTLSKSEVCGKIGTSRALNSNECFRLHFKNEACSETIEVLSHSISTDTCMCVGGNSCCAASSIVGAAIREVDYKSCEGYIIIKSSNINSITLSALACSAVANKDSEYHNCSSVSITSISHMSGATFQFINPNIMCAYNPNSLDIGNGGGSLT
jgi:hypothetical protein